LESLESILYHLSTVMSNGRGVSGGSEIESVVLEMLTAVKQASTVSNLLVMVATTEQTGNEGGVGMN